MNASSTSNITKAKRREAISTLLWVSFITVIIWVWADLEQTRTELVEIPVVFVTDPATDMLLEEPGPKGIAVRFTCRGAQGRIEQFTRDIAERAAGSDPVRCVVQLGSKLEAGDHYLSSDQILSNWELLRKSGLSAEDPSPASLQVKLDEWVYFTADVVLRTSNDAALEEKTIEPAQVQLRMARSDYQAIKDRQVISTAPVDLTTLPLGQNVDMQVNLARGIEGKSVEFIDSDSVNVKLRIARRTVTQTIKLPVKLMCPPELLEKADREGFRFDRKDTSADGEWLIELTVSGDRKDIEKLRSDPAAAGARAYVTITASDFEKTAIHPDRPVEIKLPQGINLLAPENPKVHFKFDPKAAN